MATLREVSTSLHKCVSFALRSDQDPPFKQESLGRRRRHAGFSDRFEKVATGGACWRYQYCGSTGVKLLFDALVSAACAFTQQKCHFSPTISSFPSPPRSPRNAPWWQISAVALLLSPQAKPAVAAAALLSFPPSPLYFIVVVVVFPPLSLVLPPSLADSLSLYLFLFSSGSCFFTASPSPGRRACGALWTTG